MKTTILWLLPMLLAGQVSPKPAGESAANPILDPAKLLKPATDAWPTYNGDYSGRRYSSLRLINQLNVRSMSLAWIYRAAVGPTFGSIVGGTGPDVPPVAGRENGFGGLQIKA